MWRFSYWSVSWVLCRCLMFSDFHPKNICHNFYPVRAIKILRARPCPCWNCIWTKQGSVDTMNDWVLDRLVHRTWANLDYDVEPGPEIKPATSPEKNMNLVFRPLCMVDLWYADVPEALEDGMYEEEGSFFWKNIFGALLDGQLSINSNIARCSSWT